MKKKYFFSALAAGMVLFSACSQHDDVLEVADLSSSAQQIVLQVPSTGDGLQTRAGRQLYSAEAKQDIQTVKVIVTDAQDVVKYVATVSNWGTASTAYTTGGHGREKNIVIDPKLEAGTYTIYAVGYSDNSDYDLSAINVTASDPGTDEPTKFTANTVLTFKQDATNKVGEEIFAGSTEQFTLSKDGEEFKKSVVLNRQVAGTFGYFKEIPYIEGAAKLQLVASQLNTKLVLGDFSNTDLTGNGTSQTTSFVVNGITAGSEKVVYTIDLEDWFTTIANDEGLIATSSWKNPYEDTGATFEEGSVFGGSFIIPFVKTANETFVLKLTDNTGSELRRWIVKLPSNDSQVKAAYTLATWSTDENIWKFDDEAKDSEKVYSVLRNHLYGIGKKMYDNPDDPNNPVDPDPDPEEDDDPESLNNKQELILRVNDNWEVIHQMELE